MKSKLFYASLLLFTSLNCNAVNIIASEAKVASYLQSKSSKDEHAESQGFGLYDFDNDNVPEIVIVWSLLGATYWTNHISALKLQGNGYTEISTLQLNGEAKFKEIIKGRIFVEQTVYAPTDPICCPSIEKVMAYKLFKNKIKADGK